MNKYLLILISILVCFWILWLPGQRVANDYHINSKESQIVGLYPWIWKEVNAADGLGEYTISTLWSQPIHTFFGSLALLNISFSIQTKILILLTILLGFFSFNRLLDYLKINGPGKYIGTFFYLTNTFFLLLVDGGQISIALGYVVVPLNICNFLKTFDNPSLKNKIYFAFSLILISFLDIRFIFLLFLIFLIKILYVLILSPRSKIVHLIKNIISLGFFVGIVLVGIHAFWLLPAFLSRDPQLPQTYERITQIDFLSFSSLINSIFLQQPHWYKNVFGQISYPGFEFFIIPLLVFLAPILKKRNKQVGFWLIVALLGIFLSKGSKEPLGIVYVWLFTHIPGFSLFRDPVKFYTLIALSYSVLISITMTSLSKFIKFAPVLIIIFFLFILRPVYLGQMTGMFSFPRYENEYLEQGKILSQDASFSRIFWIPSHEPLGYTNVNHPWIGAVRASKQRPFAAGTKGTYETFNFLREAPYMGEIFDVAGVGYISYPYLDPKRDEMSHDNQRYFYVFLDQLSKIPWLTKIDSSPMPLFKVKTHQDKFFAPQNIWWVIGSDNIYNEATKSAKLKLSKNSLIFAEEYPGLGEKLEQLSQAKIVLNNKTAIDLAAGFINSSNLIFPAKNLNFEPDNSGWWKREAADLVDWRAFLQTKYKIDNQDFDLGGGWAVGEGKLELRIKNSELMKNKILLARVLESTRSGELSFSQEGQLVGKINTKKEGNNVRWFEVGELKSGGELEITSVGDINVVNTAAVLDKNEWENYKNKAKEFEGRIVSFDEKNAQEINSPKIIYQKINPTKYLVNISGLTHPTLLVFSQNYDTLWKLNGQTSLPVYSLLNGFKIEKDGQYEVQFEAQKYVYPGLIISGLTAVILVLALVKSSKSS